MRYISLALLCLIGSANLHAQEPSRHAGKAVEIIQQLRTIGVPEPDWDRTAPPARVPGLLRQLNLELKGLLVDALNDQTLHDVIPSESEILDRLRAAGWDELPSNKWNAYGEIRRIKFDWKLDYDPGLLVVTTQLWLPCQGRDPDAAIYIFQGRARQWKLMLATDSDFDPANGEDSSGMQYQISPPDKNGNWFLVIAHLPPSSCSFRHDVLRYKALRPGEDPDRPLVLISRRETLPPDPDSSFDLSVEADSFEVSTGKIRKLDAKPGDVIFRYYAYPKQAQRIAPLASAPEDLLDQWAQLDWDEAKRWTNGGSEVLQGWHSQLGKLLPDSTEMPSVGRCSRGENDDGSWLIELWIDQKLNPTSNDETLYIEISRQHGTFYVESVQNVRPSGCPGGPALSPITKERLPDR